MGELAILQVSASFMTVPGKSLMISCMTVGALVPCSDKSWNWPFAMAAAWLLRIGAAAAVPALAPGVVPFANVLQLCCSAEIPSPHGVTAVIVGGAGGPGGPCKV